MPFTIIRQDITKMNVDAIVNAANTELAMGGGVCGAIFRAAGIEELEKACAKLAPIQTGEAVITPGFNLAAKYIIHCTGPVYQDGMHNEEKLLRSAYTNALKRALEHKCESIAFPLISSGIFGYPKEEALRVATSAIQDFLEDHELDVILTVYDKASFAISEQLLGAVESYIDEHLILKEPKRHMRLASEERVLTSPLSTADTQIKLALPSEEPVFKVMLDEPFNAVLLKLIDAKGKTDIEIYKKANLDRKLFSKIRIGQNYLPSKRTAIALAIALNLNLRETADLLSRAGYALSRSQLFDVIVSYFIESGNYDIFSINEVLFEYDQPLLGGK